jgi:hypothetical protein
MQSVYLKELQVKNMFGAMDESLHIVLQKDLLVFAN